MCLQKITGILCNRSRDCFCRKIKYLISKIFSNGTESAGHLLVLVLGLVLLREKAKCGECKETVQ